jgi:hypothetical protein
VTFFFIYIFLYGVFMGVHFVLCVFFFSMGYFCCLGKRDWIGLDCVCGCIEEDLCSGHWVGFVTDGIRSSSLLISTLLCFFVCVFACFFLFMSRPLFPML